MEVKLPARNRSRLRLHLKSEATDSVCITESTARKGGRPSRARGSCVAVDVRVFGPSWPRCPTLSDEAPPR
jgi:hypothetical protein